MPSLEQIILILLTIAGIAVAGVLVLCLLILAIHILKYFRQRGQWNRSYTESRPQKSESVSEKKLPLINPLVPSEKLTNLFHLDEVAKANKTPFPGDFPECQFKIHQELHYPNFLKPSLPYHSNKPFSGKSYGAEWGHSMQQIGQNLNAKGVSHVVLIHGTFAGFDPIDTFYFIHECLDRLEKRQIFGFSLSCLVRPLRKINLKLTTIFNTLKDLIVLNSGNFTDTYCNLLQLSLAKNIKIHRVQWNSGNHHNARIRGFFNLLETLLIISNQPNTGKILLIGHSHAGQILAILSRFLAPRDPNSEHEFALELSKVYLNCPQVIRSNLFPGVETSFENTFGDQNFFQGHFLKLAEKLRSQPYLYLTLGMAPRYQFGHIDQGSLLHLINFRAIPKKLSIFKILHAADGDGIHFFAGPGSDTLSLCEQIRKDNDRLDLILGIGHSPPSWLSFSKHHPVKARYFHNLGFHLFIDYHDQGWLNWRRSFLGHGIYTLPEFMPLILNLATAYFFNEKKDS